MKTVSLSGSPRENVGKKDAKKNRRQGLVPCVMYGGAQKQKQFTVVEKELVKFIWSPNVYQYDISLDGEEHKAILQDIQFHPVTDRVLHVDFYEIKEDKPFSTSLPVNVVGSSVGLTKGGKVYKNRRKLRVKGLLKDMPEMIDIDISSLDINDTVKVKELERENITFLDPGTDVIIAIKSAKAMAAMGADMEVEEEEEGEEGEEDAAEGEEGAAEGSSEEGSESKEE